MSLRPILKRPVNDSPRIQSSSAPTPPPRTPTPKYLPIRESAHKPSACVHFPPSPVLTRTFPAYTSAAYDRSPIVVAPNTCAMPARGCPGRTYTLDDDKVCIPSPTANKSSKRVSSMGKHMHPRTLNKASPVGDINKVPALIPDVSSSESDESDAFLGHIFDPAPSLSSNAPFDGRPSTPTQLSYLPYPHHSRADEEVEPLELDPVSKPRRKPRRRSRERRDRDRDAKMVALEDGYSTFSIRDTSLSLSSSFSQDDSGCLGGF